MGLDYLTDEINDIIEAAIRLGLGEEVIETAEADIKDGEDPLIAYLHAYQEWIK